jgi:RHS repeat-associated protein
MRFLSPIKLWIVNVFILIACVSSGSAQTMELTSDISRPIPNAGHDYVKGLNETVNPANGSLSIKITLPTPASRGLSLPFSLIYNSGIVHHTALEFYNGGDIISLQMDGAAVPPDRSINGWSDTIPYATASSFSTHIVPPNPQGDAASCGISTAYQLYDAEGQAHQLGINALAPVFVESGHVASTCDSNGWPQSQTWSADGYTGSITGGTCNGVSSAGMAPYCGYASPPFTATDLENTVYTFPGDYVTMGYSSPNLTPLMFPTSIEDRNGNIVKITGAQPDGQGNTTPAVVYDTAGRVAERITYLPGTSVPSSYEVGGLTYTLVYTTTLDNYTASSKQVFPHPTSPQICNAALTSHYSGKQAIQNIYLPNGEKYSFQYDTRFGLLKRIDYPNGGWVTYAWQLSSEAPNTGLSDFLHFPAQLQPLSSNDLCNYQYAVPVIEQRQVGYTPGTTALTQTFTYTTNWNASGSPIESQWLSKVTTVTTTDNVTGKTFKTAYTYVPGVYQHPPTRYAAAWLPQIPVEQSVVTYDWGPSTAFILSQSKVWADPYEMTSETDLLHSGQSSKVAYSYDGGARVTEKDEYDFDPSSPPRVTTYGYYSSVYASSGLSTPCQIVVHTGSATGPRVAETDVYYDGGTATCASGKGATTSAGSLAVFPDATSTHDEANYSPATGVFRGNVTKLVKWSNNGPSPTATFAYDETGQRVSMTDACGNTACSDVTGTGHTTTYLYADVPGGGNPAGNSNAYLTKITKPAVNGMTQHEDFSYYYDLGSLASSSDVNGNPTSYTYYGDTNLNRLQQVQGPPDPNNGNARPTTSYSYDDSVPNLTTTVTMSSGSTKSTTAKMDGLGHVVETDRSDSNTYGPDVVLSTYDGMGHLASVTNPARSSSDPSLPLGTPIKYAYDALGRMTIQTNQDASTKQWCRDGFTSSGQTTCPLNLSSIANSTWTDFYDETTRHWQRVSDGEGRLVAVMEPEASTTPTLETDYKYDLLDNLVRVDQWGGAPVQGSTSDRVRTFVYDSLSRLTNVCNPESIASGLVCTTPASGTFGSSAPGSWSDIYTYDANGNLSTKIDARVITTSYSYDALNRPLLKSYSDTTPSVHYQYDLAQSGWGWGTAPNPQTNMVGRLAGVSVGSPNAWILYGYDTIGRITMKSECLPRDCGSNHHDMRFGYDLAGDMTFYDRGTDLVRNNASPNQGYYFGGFNMTYDPAGNIKTVTADTTDANHPATILSNTVYTPLGGLFTANMVGTYLQTRTYNNRGWYTGIYVINSSGQPIWSTSTGYFKNASVSSSTDTWNGSWSYLYGNTNRLAQAIGSSLTLAYTYDHWGNRTSQLITTGSGMAPQWRDQQYNANNHLTTTWTHDAAGNVAYDGFHNYQYDAENRVKNVDITTGGATVYAYDGENNRVAQLSNTGTVQKEYLYDFQGRLMTEVGLDFKAARANIYVGNELFAEDAPDPYRASTSTATLLRIGDQLGTLRARWDVGSDWVGACSSLPYGDAMTCSVSPSDMQFTGKQRDQESDLDYFGARYYNSTRGRFMSPDWSAKPEAVPYSDLTNPQSLNLYGYVRNNPLTNADKDGHGQCDWCWNLAARLGVYVASHPDIAMAAGRVVDSMGVKLSLGAGAKGSVGVAKGQLAGSGYVSFSPKGAGAGAQADVGASVAGVGGKFHVDVPVVSESTFVNPLANISLTSSGTAGGESGKVGGEASANGQEVSVGGTYGEGVQVGVEGSTGASELQGFFGAVADAVATNVSNVVDTLQRTNGCSNLASCGTAASH